MFQKRYGVRFIYLCLAEIVDEMITLNFLSISLGATDVCYIRVVKMMIKQKCAFLEAEEQACDAAMLKAQ